MAALHLAGRVLGAGTAMRKGGRFLRIVPLAVVFALVGNLAYEQGPA
ncbi:hypothetical protein [Streptomyces sp. NPDC058335]